MQPYKSWDELNADEKNGWLHNNLSQFIEHSNEQGIVRNLALEALKARVAALETELRRMASRLARLER